MKTSTEINSSSRILGEERAVEYIAKAGFDAWDFSMFSMFEYSWSTKTVFKANHPFFDRNYLAFARRLKQIGMDNGIVCNQSHAPFPCSCMEIRSYYKRAIECTSEAGGKICVIHPDSDISPEENAIMYLELMDFACDCGVMIATENMWSWNKDTDRADLAACSTPDAFLKQLNAVNHRNFVACLDIGHAEMMGDYTNAVQMIEALGSHIQALHIHDNDKWRDRHQIPFSMNIDFPSVVKALKGIGYKGYLTLEADSFLGDYTEENIFDGIKKLAQSAKRLADIYDEI